MYTQGKEKQKTPEIYPLNLSVLLWARGSGRVVTSAKRTIQINPYMRNTTLSSFQ